MSKLHHYHTYLAETRSIRAVVEASTTGQEVKEAMQLLLNKSKTAYLNVLNDEKKYYEQYVEKGEMLTNHSEIARLQLEIDAISQN